MEDAFGKDTSIVDKYISESVTAIKTAEARHNIKDMAANNPLQHAQKKA